MIVNGIVANLQFPLMKAYQLTEKQSSTQCQWKDKVNKHLWIIQACLWKKIMLNDCFFQSRWTAYYTCQLFLRCRREIFILGVLGFLKTTRSFPKIPEEVQSLPKTSEVCRRRSYRENAYPQNQRSRWRYCHLFILHMVFVPYMGLS